MNRLLITALCVLSLSACVAGPPTRGGPYLGDTPWNISSKAAPDVARHG